jgi:hypothetical protein
MKGATWKRKRKYDDNIKIAKYKKGKNFPCAPQMHTVDWKQKSYEFKTSALCESEWSASRSGCPIVEEIVPCIPCK